MDGCINRNENGLCMLFDTFFPEKRPTACNEWGECILDDGDFADTNEFEGECEAFEPDTPIMDEEGEEHEPEYDDYMETTFSSLMKNNEKYNKTEAKQSKNYVKYDGKSRKIKYEKWFNYNRTDINRILINKFSNLTPGKYELKYNDFKYVMKAYEYEMFLKYGKDYICEYIKGINKNSNISFSSKYDSITMIVEPNKYSSDKYNTNKYDDYAKKSYGEEMKSFDNFYEDAIMTGSFCTPTDSSAQPAGGKLTPSNFIGTNRSRKRKKEILQKRKIY